MKPPDSFVPLTGATAPSAPREFQVAILNAHDHASPVGHEQSGRAVKNSGFQTIESSKPLGSSTSRSGEKKTAADPRVTLQRDGDRVTHIRIQCSCGMIVDLACMYDPPKAGG